MKYKKLNRAIYINFLLVHRTSGKKICSECEVNLMALWFTIYIFKYRRNGIYSGYDGYRR